MMARILQIEKTMPEDTKRIGSSLVFVLFLLWRETKEAKDHDHVVDLNLSSLSPRTLSTTTRIDKTTTTRTVQRNKPSSSQVSDLWNKGSCGLIEKNTLSSMTTSTDG